MASEGLQGGTLVVNGNAQWNPGELVGPFAKCARQRDATTTIGFQVESFAESFADFVGCNADLIAIDAIATTQMKQIADSIAIEQLQQHP